MEWEWEPEPQDLGALGFAGICRETRRVIRQAILPNFTNRGPVLLAALLLANTAARSVLSPRVVYVIDDGYGLFHLIADGLAASFTVVLWLHRTAVYVLCVASLYRTGDNFLAADRVLKEDHPVPVVKLRRLFSMFLFVAVPFLVVSIWFPVAVSLLRVRLKVKTVLPMRLLGWASAAYVTVVGQLACVVSVLEDAARFGAVRRSRELLAGKFVTAACFFFTVDGYFLALLKAATVVVVDDALGLGLAFQMAVWAAIFAALSGALVVTLVAPTVVYMVCKSHQQGLVDKAHLA